jgi:hypothetical protein
VGFHLDHVRRKKRGHEEQSFQARLARALAAALTPRTFWFAVPNGGYRTPIEGALLKGQGVKPGVPDLLFIHEGKAFGLELKSEKGTLSIAQRAAHVALQDAGMRVEVVRSVDEALARLREFGIPLRVRAPEVFR